MFGWYKTDSGLFSITSTCSYRLPNSLKSFIALLSSVNHLRCLLMIWANQSLHLHNDEIDCKIGLIWEGFAAVHTTNSQFSIRQVCMKRSTWGRTWMYPSRAYTSVSSTSSTTVSAKSLTWTARKNCVHCAFFLRWRPSTEVTQSYYFLHLATDAHSKCTV